MARANKNPNLKKANQQHGYEIDQIKELERCMEDPVYFITHYCQLQHPIKGAIPFEMYPYQRNMVNAFKDNRYVIGCLPRQVGKSWSSGAFLLWYACFHDDKTILIASNKDTNAQEMIGRIRFMYERMPHWLKPGLTADGWNKHSVGFDNRSRIISTATSEDSGRGLSISLLYLDEFAFVRDSIQEDFWSSISPTLSAGGACIITSTPNGDTNIFAELWRGALLGATAAGIGSNGFMPVQVAWNEPPGRDEKFKQEQISKIGDIKWRQEYLCEFLSSDPLLFNTISVANLYGQVKNNKPISTQGYWNFYKMPKQNGTYIIGLDPATGTGSDMTAIQIFEFPSLEQIAEYRSNTTSSVTAYGDLKRIFRVFEKMQCTVYFSAENNGVGEGVIALFENDETQSEIVEMVSETGKTRVGMTTTGKIKLAVCQSMKEMVERGTMKIHSPFTVEEMKHFVRKNNSWSAKRGATDDSLSACMIVIRILREISSYDQDAYDKLYKFSGEEDSDDGWDDNDTPLPIII